jgi:hypothetical protein
MITKALGDAKELISSVLEQMKKDRAEASAS